MARVASPIKLACLMLTITQLLCDNSQDNKRSIAIFGFARANEQEANSDLDADNSDNMQSVKSFQTNDQDNKQQFIEQPQDVYAVVGQPEVTFSCVVLGKRGLMAWRYSSPNLLATDLFVLDSFSENPTFVTLDKYSVSRPNQSLGQQRDIAQQSLKSSAPDSTAAAAAGSKSPTDDDDDSIASNYTLHIRNVTLANDDFYQCSVQAKDKTHRFIESRRARLHVLQPPTRLDLTVARISAHSREEFPEIEPDPQDTPHNINDQSPSASSDSAALNRQQQQQIRVVEVEENVIVRLECSTNQAKPEAEIIWFDSDTGRRIVAPQKSTGSSQPDDPDSPPPLPSSEAGSITIETRTQPLNDAFHLEQTISVLSIRTDRKLHHNKVFTCQTKHKAYELNNSSALSSNDKLRPLRQSARLSVLYGPQVDLDKDQMQPTELSPITFTCSADARPGVQNFSWFVDDHLIEGAHEPELYISSLTRQLHLREIKCEARNSVGVGSALIRLAVKYSPAYVTHLLPASLQPDHNQHDHHQYLDHRSVVGHSGKPTAASLNGRSKEPIGTLFENFDRSLSRELALSRFDHENITLRCDFDSNPGPQQIQWYKISTDYSTMKDISPQEANELIEIGANHAQFISKNRQEQQQASTLSKSRNHGNELWRQSRRDHDKRHINQPPGDQVQDSHTRPRNLLENQPDQLDFVQMSHDLIVEMSILEAKQRRQHQEREALRGQNGTTDGQETRVIFIEEVNSEPISQSNTHKIREPLAFVVRRHVDFLDNSPAASRQRNLPVATRLSGPASEPQQMSDEQQQQQQQHRSTRAAELVLLDGQHELESAVGKQSRNGTYSSNHYRRGNTNWIATERILNERQAQLTSSSLTLKNVNHESIGKYICLAKAHDGFETVAKSVYFVLKQPPRIISENKQSAPLGAYRVQVECLVQINTILDNQTRVQWFREGKLIDASHKIVPGKLDKSYAIFEQLSPDALFMRSILHIEGAEFSDFGLYNCTITNKLGVDSMAIFLQPTASTGFAFTVIAQLVMASCVLFVAIVCVLFTLVPCKSFDSFAGRKSIGALKAKNMVVMADGKAHLADVEPTVRSTNERNSSSPSSQSNHSAAKRSINSSQASTVTHQDELDQVPSSCVMTTIDQLPPPPPVPSILQQHAAIMMMQNGTGGINARLSIRPESALGTSSTFAATCNELNTTMSRDRFNRASLRSECNYQTPTQARNGRPNMSLQQQNPPGPNRFAAIHETLEHKLNFGSGATANGFISSSSMPANRSDNQNDSNQEPTSNHSDSTVTFNYSSNHVELASSGSQTNVTKQTKTSLVNKIRGKFKSGSQEKPTTKNRQASLGGSNTLGKSRPTISGPIGGMLRTSSLSSSLTMVNDQDSIKQSQPSGTQIKHSMMINLNHINGGAESNLISSSANLIQNSGTTSDNTTSSGRSSSASNNPNGHPQQFHMQHQQHQQQQQTFAVPHMNLAYQAQQQQQPQPWTHHQVQLTPSNCDNNMLYANSANLYDLANDQQQLYANGYPQAIDPNSLVNPYGQYQPQQQIMMNQQQLQPQQEQIMTGDGGDAYYESNYGTLLSRSSAYKTLGYDISNFIS